MMLGVVKSNGMVTSASDGTVTDPDPDAGNDNLTYQWVNGYRLAWMTDDEDVCRQANDEVISYATAAIYTVETADIGSTHQRSG